MEQFVEAAQLSEASSNLSRSNHAIKVMGCLVGCCLIGLQQVRAMFQQGI